WLAEMEARGDVDWREVKALHDQWDYDHSGMSAAAQLVVAIVVAYYVGPMATKLVAGGASTGALAAGGWANVAAATSLTSVASNAAVSTINQQGDLGEAWGDVTSSDALRGYAVAGMTAGLTNGLYNGWTGTQTGLTTGLPNSGMVTGAPLGTWQGAGQFGANQLLQNTTSALLDRALGGDAALGDAFQASLANTFAAAGFNAIGNTSLENGSLNKAALHAVMGGLAAEAAGGDFTTGALAAGANELLVDKLAGEYSDLDQADKGRLLVMNSQIIGVIAAEIASNDDSELQIGAQVAGSATQYNRLLHPTEKALIDEKAKELEATYGALSAELSWEDMLTLVSGAELDATESARYTALIGQLDTSDGSFFANKQFAEKMLVALDAFDELALDHQGDTLTWNNGESIVAHGQPVRPFQSTPEQYADRGLFGDIQVTQQGVPLDDVADRYGSQQAWVRQGEIGGIGAAAPDTSELLQGLVHAASPGQVENADWVSERAIDLLTLGSAAAFRASLRSLVKAAASREADTVLASAGSRVSLPRGSIELKPAGAQPTTPPGYKVYQSPEGNRYYVSPEGQTYASLGDVPGGYSGAAMDGLLSNVSQNGNLVNLVPSDAVVAQRPIRTLVQDSAGRYWLQTQGGERITPSGRYDFVTMPNGIIRVSRRNLNPDFSTHLGLSGGGEVKFAGSIRFYNNDGPRRGEIVGWSNDSGHYRPPATLKDQSGLPESLFNAGW
ncbi:DUF637 domain-containing protein, partial [Halomonas cupida]